MSYKVLLLIACVTASAMNTSTVVDVRPPYSTFSVPANPLACSAVNPNTLSIGFNSKFFADMGYSYAGNPFNVFSASTWSLPFNLQSSNQALSQVLVNGVYYDRGLVPIHTNTTSSLLPVFDGTLAWPFRLTPTSYTLELYNTNHSFIFSTPIIPRSNSFQSLSASLTNPTTFDTGCLTLNFSSPCAYLPTSTIIEINIPELFGDKDDYRLSAFDAFDDAVCAVTLAGFSRPPGLRCTKTSSSLYIYNLFASNYTQTTGSLRICNLKTTFGALATPVKVRLLSNSDLSSNSTFVANTLLLSTTAPKITVSNTSLLQTMADNKWRLSFRLSHSATFIMPLAYKVEVQFSSYCFNTSQVNVSMLHQDATSPATYNSLVSSTSSLISYVLGADLKLDKGGVMTITGINKPNSSSLTAQIILRDKFNRALSQQELITLAFP